LSASGRRIETSRRVICTVLTRRRRENEAAFLEKLNEGIAKGTAWERITELISLENSREWRRCFARPAKMPPVLGLSPAYTHRIQDYPSVRSRR
jgi:hypothetical protein